MSLRDTHEAGLDVLGAGVGLGTFAPWLGIVGGALSGLAGGGVQADPSAQKAAIEKALAAEREKQAKARAEAEAAKTRTILYVSLGAMGVAILGTTMYMLTRKGK